MTISPPPRNFSRLSLSTIAVDAGRLFRISRYGSGEPYFGKTGFNRFDDRSLPKKNRFGTCYLGFDLETAIAETVLHDENSYRGQFNIAYSQIESRYVVRFKHNKLILANLTGNSLKILGGEGSISTVTPYRVPQLWAMSIHRHPNCVDGIYYMSRHLNDRSSVVVFERARAKLVRRNSTRIISFPGSMKAITNLNISFKY